MCVFVLYSQGGDAFKDGRVLLLLWGQKIDRYDGEFTTFHFPPKYSVIWRHQ